MAGIPGWRERRAGSIEFHLDKRRPEIQPYTLSRAKFSECETGPVLISFGRWLSVGKTLINLIASKIRL